MLFQWACRNEIPFKEVTIIPVLFFRYGLHKKPRDHYLNDPPNTNTTSDPATCHRIQVPWIDTDTNKDVNKTRNAEITLNEFNYLLWMTDLHESKW